MNIIIFGAGYVGMSLGVLLSQKNKVTILEIDLEKIQAISNKKSTVKDKLIDHFLASKDLDLSSGTSSSKVIQKADLFIVATPTNYDAATNSFDTTSVESVLEDIFRNNKNQNAMVVIKSTVPVGFTISMNNKFKSNRIIFSPEFLREGFALEDNLNPSRIIVGGTHPRITNFTELLCAAADIPNPIIQYMDSSSAEAVKLFANTYLAMRVSFFNELDSFAIEKSLDPLMVINGVCADPRIGDFYNNPSFGYGGYCLPKDTKQLLSNYSSVPQNLIQAIVDANETRKKYIANQILRMDPARVGIYKLAMKEGSDNFRDSSIIGVIEYLLDNKVDVVIYEPLIKKDKFNGVEVCKDLQKFKSQASIIVANRISEELIDVSDKIFTRDLYTVN
jgi:UDPglucose 6-dehydrogenase